MYTSLKDVAARAGVSVQTASKVLNGRPGVVSEATRERIHTAARDLGYVPNALARGLVRQTSLSIGILVDDFSDPALTQFVVAAQRRVEAGGHSAIVAGTRVQGAATSGLRKLREHRVDGLLVIAPSLEHDDPLEEWIVDHLPAVALNHVAGADLPLVGSDHRVTGALAAAHLVGLGHERIATVTGPRTRRVVRSRHAGFSDTLDSLGQPLPEDAVEEAAWNPEDAHRAVRVLLARRRFTALYVHNDVMALGALAALREKGVAVPQECSVVACDDLPIAAYAAPPLTTVHLPFAETGSRAAEILLGRVRGEEVPRRTVLPVHLVVRGSTAPPDA